MSALCPSTPKWIMTETTMSTTSSPATTSGRILLASVSLLQVSSSSSLHSLMYDSGSESYLTLLLTTSALFLTSLSPLMSRESPNLSRSWGLRSPSSGFMVPTSTNFAGWENETPSLST